jgi:hypothetical protein
MKNSLIPIALSAVLLSGGAALAAGKSSCAPGQNKAALVGFYGAGGPQVTGSPTPGGVVNTLGGAISGGFYGNTSIPASIAMRQQMGTA